MNFISSLNSIVFGRIQNCIFIFAKKNPKKQKLMYQDYLLEGGIGTLRVPKILL